MPSGIYTAIDYQFRWAPRDLRNPGNWSAADRLRRFDAIIISPRWNNPDTGVGSGLENPWGKGKAVLTEGCLNLVDVGWFFLTGNANPPGTFTPALDPPFLVQDGCAHPLNDDFPVLDEYGIFAREIRSTGMHDFSASLSSPGTQGWFEPYFRLDETVYPSGKVEGPFWLVNARAVGFANLFSDYVLSHYEWADGINLEFGIVPSWWKNWAQNTWWTGLSGPAQTTFLNEFAQGMLDAIALIRAERPYWLILYQHVPHRSTDKPDPGKSSGYFRENNPFFTALQSGGISTNAEAIQDDLDHRAAVFVDSKARPYVSFWHVWDPAAWSSAQIESWKQIPRDAQSFIGIGDGTSAWEAPPDDYFTLQFPSASTLTQWSVTGAATVLAAVTDGLDTSYARSSTAGQRCLFTFPSIPGDVTHIREVNVLVRARKSSALPEAKARVVVVDTLTNESYSRDLIFGNAPQNVSAINLPSPDGGIWTPAKVNACEIGFEMVGTPATEFWMLEFQRKIRHSVSTATPVLGQLPVSRVQQIVGRIPRVSQEVARIPRVTTEVP